MRRILYAFFAFAVVALLLSGARKIFAQGGQPRSMVTRAVDETQRISLRGNVHPLANAQSDQGAVASTMQVNHMLLVLKRSPEQEAALENLIAQQADTTSPNYQKWLTPAQFGEQFGASEQDITAVTTWLGSHGFQVDGVGSGRDMIDFTGTAGEIEEAFHTGIHNYLVNGKMHFANVSDPQIPAALAPIVAGVNRLNNFRPQPMVHPSGAVKMDMKTHRVTSATPNLTLTGLGQNGCYGNNTNCYAVTPYDFATIYDLAPLWQANNTGSGVHIAIISDSNINSADYQQFRTLMGLPAETVNVKLASGVDPGLQNCSLDSDEQEAILDVEWAGGVAPGATIDLVAAPSAGSCGSPSTTGITGLPSGDTFGGDFAAYYAVNTLNDPILTDSYGECELGLGSAGNAFYNTLWQQANAQGIVVIAASGDNGSAGCDSTTGPAQLGLEVNGAASTPYNTAVGGTEFNYDSASGAAAYWNASNSTSGTSATLSAKGAIPETVYNDSCTNPQITSLLGLGTGTTPFNTCNSTQAANASVNVLVAVGSSGGFSNCTTPTGLAASDCAGGYGKPTWQTGTPADSHRDIPDVSLFAGDGTVSGTFYVVCEEDAFVNGSPSSPPTACALQGASAFFAAEGGTSVSAQAFGGLVAVLEQVHGKRYSSTALNTQLYALAGSGSGFTGPSPRPWIQFRWTPMGITLLACTLGAVIVLALLPQGRRRWSSAFALLLLAAMFGGVSCSGGGGGSNNGSGSTGSANSAFRDVTTGNNSVPCQSGSANCGSSIGSGGGGTVTQANNGVGVLTGYNAATGYDLATGLGSVDANLLIKASGW